jgi:hypothetical protein
VISERSGRLPDIVRGDAVKVVTFDNRSGVHDLQCCAVAVLCSRVVIFCSDTRLVPVPAYSERTCHSTLLDEIQLDQVAFVARCIVQLSRIVKAEKVP